ncbi:PHD finger protein 11-like protein [Camelus ferus]|nr:PHD finger protein 11-like protein [Camelus ferus]
MPLPKTTCEDKLSFFSTPRRLLSRSNTDKPDAIEENGKEENITKNMFSKKRKIEVADCEVEVIPLELETHPGSAVTEACPPKLHLHPKEPTAYVKARTELTWDYGYEAGTMPEKEILCQCGVQAVVNFGLGPPRTYSLKTPNTNFIDVWNNLKLSVFQVAEKLQKRRCALCPKDFECSVLYFAQSENIAAHENCLLYSSALVECEDHDSYNDGRHFDVLSVKKEINRGRKLPLERMTLNRFVKQMKEKDGRPTDAIVKATFLKKCKEAGLLNTLFEEILDKLHSIQGRLMDETTSESDYEEIGTSLFDCRLFEDTLVNLQAAIENKIHQSEEQQRQLKEEIELLQDLKQTLCSDLQSSSTSDSSLSS